MKFREAGLLVLLIALLIYARMVDPAFVTLRAQGFLAPHVWELAIVALPMLVIIVSGGIDLSVGSTVALSAVTLGLLFERGVHPFVAAGVAVLAGTCLGAINGWFIARMRVHPLIVTLASLAAYRGVAEGISTARPISGYPESFLNLSRGPIPMLVFAVLAIVCAVFLGRTVSGRWVYALGTNEKATLFTGIPVDKLKMGIYAACGCCCGMAAVLMVARNNTAKADMASGMELEAITAVVLGGASIQGGTGSVTGVLLGLALIHETREFVSWHWKQNELNLIVIGGLLLASVLVQRLLDRNRVVSRS